MSAQISVIIPTLNDPLINQVVESVINELPSGGEIIVVGRDETGRVSSNNAVRFIDTGHPVGASTARNLGIQAAEGEWLFFIDADCLAQPRWGKNLTARLSKGEDVVGGGVTFPVDNYWALAYNISMFHKFSNHNPAGLKQFLPALNLAVRREVIDKVGLMDESLPRSQDVDWTTRMALAGYRLYFDPQAVISHHPCKINLSAVWRYWMSSGYYSSRNRLRYAEYYRTPRLLTHSSLVRLLSPLIAAYVTTDIFARSPRLLRYIHTAPAIYLTKIAWLLGASQHLKSLATL